MVGIQSEAALELWTEYSCATRLKQHDLEQARVPWDISFWPVRLHNFLPLRLKQTPVISCCPSVHTYSTNWSKSVMSQHPLTSFGLLHTFKNVRLWIPDSAASFHGSITLVTHILLALHFLSNSTAHTATRASFIYLKPWNHPLLSSIPQEQTAFLSSSLYNPAGEHPLNPAHDIYARRFYWSKTSIQVCLVS